MTFARAARWLLVPVGAMGSCTGSLTVTHVLGRIAETSVSPLTLEAILPIEFRVGIANAIAAALFVVIGAMVAPRYRMFVSVLLYAIGATIAWEFLEGWYFPEHHARAYQPSLVPLRCTLLGGFIGVIAIIAWTRPWRRPAAIPLTASQFAER